MITPFGKIFLPSILALTLGASACTSGGFAGSSGKEKKEDKDKGGDGGSGDDPNDVDQGAEGGDPTDVDKDGAGGSDAVELDDGRIQQTFEGEASQKKLPVDIIFAMDTSGSMDDEKNALESNMAKFMSTFETKAEKADYRIYMIGEDFNFPGSSDKITKINEKVGSHDALEVLADFINGKISNPKPLRKDASKALVVVTDDKAGKGDDDDDDDDDDKPSGANNAAGFKSLLQSHDSFKGKTSFHGFVGLPTSIESSWCTIENVGQDYITLAADSEVGGLIQDLCTEDWGKLLQDLATRIIKVTGRADFELKSEADPDKKIEVTVDGNKMSDDDFKYDEDTNSIVFAEGKEPGKDDKVVVTYFPK